MLKLNYCKVQLPNSSMHFILEMCVMTIDKLKSFDSIDNVKAKIQDQKSSLSLGKNVKSQSEDHVVLATNHVNHGIIMECANITKVVYQVVLNKWVDSTSIVSD